MQTIIHENVMKGTTAMKKHIYAISSILIAAAIFTGCGGDTSADTTRETEITETKTAETTGYTSSIEATDFGGETITFLTYNNTDVRNSTMDIAAEEQNGDVLNYAIFTRNTLVEEKFNVDLVHSEQKNTASVLTSSVLSGDGAYDVSLLQSQTNFQIGLQGILLNMNEMPHIDLNKAWWNSQVAADMEILGVNYFYISDMNLDTWMQSYVVYFNKKLAADYEVENLYNTVRNGKWTIEKLDEITRTIYSDLNGNTEYDENDLYGLSSCSICIDCFWASSGITFVGKNDKGELELTIGDDFYDIYDQISELLQAPEMLYTDRPDYKRNRAIYDRGAFKEDRALFFIEGLCIAESDLRDMQTDFGIIPMPKHSEEQDTYITYSHSVHNSSISLPITLTEDRMDMVCMVLEDIAYYSMEHVRPAYYEKVLSGKIARDDDSIDMLEIITQNISYDLGFVVLNNDLLNMNGLRQAVSNATPAASYIASKEAASNAALDKAMEAIRANKGM